MRRQFTEVIWKINRLTLLLLATLATAMAVVIPDRAFACRFAFVSAEEHLGSVQVVFSGEITTIEDSSTSVGRKTAIARVDWIWKGDIGRTVEFEYSPDGGTCGIYLSEGYYDVIMLRSDGSRLTTDQIAFSPHINIDVYEVIRVLGVGKPGFWSR